MVSKKNHEMEQIEENGKFLYVLDFVQIVCTVIYKHYFIHSFSSSFLRYFFLENDQSNYIFKVCLGFFSLFFFISEILFQKFNLLFHFSICLYLVCLRKTEIFYSLRTFLKKNFALRDIEIEAGLR